MHYIFDGSFAGFLCCIFERFERKELGVEAIAQEDYVPLFFHESREVVTIESNAKRVVQGLEKQLGKQAASDFFNAFLSEDRAAWKASFNVMQRLFNEGKEILNNYGDKDVLYFFQTLKKVSRERHRMKAFIRFKKTNDGMYFALIEPDFNVLPLIVDFFRKRYADQPWLIYDVKRKYGLLYDLKTVSEVQLSEAETGAVVNKTIEVVLDDRDELFQRLWQAYFKSTNIEARRNIKLHLQHVPKRYWKYLSEKLLVKFPRQTFN